MPALAAAMIELHTAGSTLPLERQPLGMTKLMPRNCDGYDDDKNDNNGDSCSDGSCDGQQTQLSFI